MSALVSGGNEVREMRNRQAWPEGCDVGFISNERATKVAKGE